MVSKEEGKGSSFTVLHTLYNVCVTVSDKVKFVPQNRDGSMNVRDHYHYGKMIGSSNGKPVILNCFYYDINESDRGKEITALVRICTKKVGEQTYMHLDFKKVPRKPMLWLKLVPSPDVKTIENVFKSFTVSHHTWSSVIFLKSAVAIKQVVATPVVVSTNSETTEKPVVTPKDLSSLEKTEEIPAIEALLNTEVEETDTSAEVLPVINNESALEIKLDEQTSTGAPAIITPIRTTPSVVRVALAETIVKKSCSITTPSIEQVFKTTYVNELGVEQEMFSFMLNNILCLSNFEVVPGEEKLFRAVATHLLTTDNKTISCLFLSAVKNLRDIYTAEIGNSSVIGQPNTEFYQIGIKNTGFVFKKINYAANDKTAAQQ